MHVAFPGGRLAGGTDGLKRRDALLAARLDLREQLVCVTRLKGVSEEQLDHRDVPQLERHRPRASQPLAEHLRASLCARVHAPWAVPLGLVATCKQPRLLELGQARIDLRW